MGPSDEALFPKVSAKQCIERIREASPSQGVRSVKQ